MSERSGCRARSLRDEERRRALAAMRACRVAPDEVLRRAIEETKILGRRPRLREVRGPRSLVAHAALLSGASGIALGRAVFIRADLFGPSGELPLDLVAHEVTHVAQLLRDGSVRFLGRYLAEYAWGLARGLGTHRAYLSIGYEIEAREVATRVTTPLKIVRRSAS